MRAFGERDVSCEADFALAENLRNVQKGRAGTQVYQTLR